MRCVVTGATGAVGPVLVDRLVEAGHSIVVYSRAPQRLAWAAGVERVAGDITDRSALERACQSADVVFHLAALLHIAHPDRSQASEYQRVNVKGTRTVVACARAAGVRRVVLFSTIAVYGPTGGAMVDEDTVPRPDTDYGRTKLEAERLALDACGESAPLASVLRLAAVYGPRVKGNYQRLVDALARRRFIPIGNGTNRRTLVFDQDVADAAIAAAESVVAAGRIYNITDGSVHQMRHIVEAICRALGRPTPRLRLPAAPIRAAAAVLETIARAGGATASVTTAAIDKYLEDVAVAGTRITADLGWRASVSIDEGWRRTVGAEKTRS